MERELNAAILLAQKEYNNAVTTLPAAECLPFSKRVKELISLRSSFLSDGAEDCPRCGQAPIGMKKRPADYRVGCTPCQISAKGETAEEAVEAWNRSVQHTERAKNF